MLHTNLSDALLREDLSLNPIKSQKLLIFQIQQKRRHLFFFQCFFLNYKFVKSNFAHITSSDICHTLILHSLHAIIHYL